MNSQNLILLETTLGNIKIKLYNETVKHKVNFLKLVSECYYNGLLFHRVIENFMIQTGDPNSLLTNSDKPLGSGGPGYTIPAEIYPEFFHKKGVIAAARLGDSLNPLKESSGSQFYIVQGQVLSHAQLDFLVSSRQHIPFTDIQWKLYTTIGGTPHLDNYYTVFGESIEGFDVIDNIASSTTDKTNKPLQDIKIIKVTLLQ